MSATQMKAVVESTFQTLQSSCSVINHGEVWLILMFHLWSYKCSLARPAKIIYTIIMSHYHTFVESEVLCMFKALVGIDNRDQDHVHNQTISRERFLTFYDMRDLRWKQERSQFHCHVVTLTVIIILCKNNADKKWKTSTLVWRHQEGHAVDIYRYAEWYIKSWLITDHG